VLKFNKIEAGISNITKGDWIIKFYNVNPIYILKNDEAFHKQYEAKK